MQARSVVFGLVLLAALVGPAKTNCAFFPNKIYQITVNIPGLDLVYATVTFLSRSLFSAYETLAENRNTNTFSDISGHYTCRGGREVNLTGTAYYYVNPASSYLNNSGAIGLFHFELRFSANRKTCTGRSIVNFYRMGSNPYQSSNTPIHAGSYADNTCVLFQ